MSGLLDNTINFMELWNQSDQDSERKIKKLILAGLDRIEQARSGGAKMIKSAGAVANPIVRWYEEYAYPTHITAQLSGSGTKTLTFSGNLFKEAISNKTINQVIRLGTILQRPSDGATAYVSDVTNLQSPTFAVTVTAHGNTSLSSNDGGAIEWDILTEAWTDEREVDQTRAIDMVPWTTGTQTFAETFQILHMRKNTKYELIANTPEHQLMALLDKLKRQEDYSLIRGVPYYSGSDYVFANASEESAMCGLCTWPIRVQARAANTAVYVDRGGLEITKDVMDDLVRNMWMTEDCDFNRGKWEFLTDPITSKYIADQEFTIRRKTMDDKKVGAGEMDVFDSKIGKEFPIRVDRYMRPGTLLCLDWTNFSRGYYAGDSPWRKVIPTKNRSEVWLITFTSYGVVARKPRQMGFVYDMPTS